MAASAPAPTRKSDMDPVSENDKMGNGEGIQLGLSDKSGALMMINKKERQILRDILAITMKSKGGKAYIARKFGHE